MSITTLGQPLNDNKEAKAAEDEKMDESHCFTPQVEQNQHKTNNN
jgi:hypothetical protein